MADKITEQPLHYQGTVRDVDRKDGLITLKGNTFHKTFRVEPECQVIRWDGTRGALEHIRPGDRVTVIYELPAGFPVASRIRDESQTFVGTVDALNLPERTVKANSGSSGEKEFTLAPGCRILVNGQEKNALSHLETGCQYRFTYEAVNGVNVTDRIVPAMGPKPAETASTR